MKPVTVEIESPYKGNKRDRVKRNVNGHPLDYYAYRGRISIAQEQAGKLYFNAYILYSGQANMAMDWTQERVDTSARSDPLTERQINAAQIVKMVSQVMDKERYIRFHAITGEGMFPKQVAAWRLGDDGRTATKAINKEWLDSLTIVAREFGYVR